MNGQKQIIFKDGCFGGLRFTEISSNEFNAAELLVSGLKPRLKKLDLEISGLDLFFAHSEKGYGSADLFWEINAPYSHKVFEFYQLDDVPDHNAEIERRNDQFEKDLRIFHQTFKPINTEDKKILEALNSILENFSERKLYAGFDSQKQQYFPVVIGWGGKFLPDTSSSGELMGVSSRLDNGDSPSTDLPEIKAPTVLTTRSYNPFYWVIWVIIFLLALLIIAKLIPSCGLRGVANTCEIASTSYNDIDDLEAYIQKLTRQSLVQHNICLQGDKTVIRDLSPVPTEGDVEIKSRLDREKVISSEVSVSLAWDTKEDLDLSVMCPNNKTVSHKEKLAAQNNCGDLDVDANFKTAIFTQPVEHIDLQPLSGIYKIVVRSIRNKYSNKTQIPTKFKVEINNSGETTLFDGSILPGDALNFSFDRQP